MKTSTIKLSCLTGVATLTCAIGLHAADLTWDADPTTGGLQDGAGAWNTTTNTWWDGANNVTWDNSTPANAIFGASSGIAGPVTVGASLTINVGNLTFNTPAAGNYNLTPGDVNSRLSFIPSSIVSVASGQIVTNTVILAGTSSFTMAGPGTFWLRPGSANLNSGITIVTNGVLGMGSTGNRVVIPGDLIATNTGDARLGGANTIVNTATVSVASGATFEMNGNALSVANYVLNGGTVTQTGTESLAVTSFDARSGAVSQSGAGTGKLDVSTLTKSTPGTVTLTSRGSATATGIANTIVNDGTLILDYTQSSSKLTDTGTLTVNGGSLVFTNGTTTETVGAVTITGGVITNSGGTSKLSVPSGSYDVRAGAVYTVLAGVAGLTKTTPGTVVLAAVDTYTGGTLISTGTLQLGDGNVNGTVNSSAITDNDTLVLDPGSSASISSVISGSGSVIKIGGGTAAFTPINSYQGSTTISNGAISIDGDATLGDGTSALNLSGGTLITTATRNASTAPVANPINLTADSAITTSSTSASTIDLNFNNNSIGGTAGTLTFSNSGSGIGGVFQPRLSGSGFNFTQPIVIANGVSGTTRLDSFNTIGTTQTFSGNISGTGGYRRNSSVPGNGGTTVFSGNNTYTGNTDVNQGTVLVNGSLGLSIVSVGGFGTLGGNGTINGPVTVQSFGTLSAGNGIGVLTISNSLTFLTGSTNYAELDKSVPANDLVRGVTTLTYAGTLAVVNLGGTLALNNTFKLFDAANYIGSFDATNLPALDPSLAWDTSGLASNGTIKVVSSGVTAPTLTVSQAGGTLTFSWTDASFKLQSQTNSRAAGLGTNWFDYPGGGASPVGVTIDPANPTVFFRLSQ